MTDRAISAVLNYAMVLGIIALLTAGLVVSMAGFLDLHRGETARSALEVTGNDFAADLETADRLARNDATHALELESSLPHRVADTHYTIEVRPDELLLRTHHPEVIVRVPYRTTLEVSEAVLVGGNVRIEYDPEMERLVVRNG